MGKEGEGGGVVPGDHFQSRFKRGAPPHLSCLVVAEGREREHHNHNNEKSLKMTREAFGGKKQGCSFVPPPHPGTRKGGERERKGCRLLLFSSQERGGG